MALQYGLIGSSSMPPNGGAFIVASHPHLMFDHFPFSWLYGYMAPQPGLIGYLLFVCPVGRLLIFWPDKVSDPS